LKIEKGVRKVDLPTSKDRPTSPNLEQVQQPKNDFFVQIHTKPLGKWKKCFELLENQTSPGGEL
jgi:hypothetical protein